MVAYELCLALSIGYSENSRQAIEVGMVNYLWPSFTMIATVVFTSQKANWLLLPGIIIAMLGVVWVLGGNEGLNVYEVFANIKTNIPSSHFHTRSLTLISNTSGAQHPTPLPPLTLPLPLTSQGAAAGRPHITET